MSLGLQFLHFRSRWVWIVEHLGIIDYVKDIIPFPILFFDFSLMFFKLFLMKKKIFSRNMWIAKESWISTFNTES
jgi:hypothetical protein